MSDMCTTGDTAHIDMIFNLLPHTRQHFEACLATTWILFRCVPCHQCCTHRKSVVVKKKLFQFSCDCEQFNLGRSFSFFVINDCNHGKHYKTPCIISIIKISYYYYYYYFQFILAHYLSGYGLLVSPDLNKRWKQFTPALYVLLLKMATNLPISFGIGGFRPTSLESWYVKSSYWTSHFSY